MSDPQPSGVDVAAVRALGTWAAPACDTYADDGDLGLCVQCQCGPAMHDARIVLAALDQQQREIADERMLRAQSDARALVLAQQRNALEADLAAAQAALSQAEQAFATMEDAYRALLHESNRGWNEDNR